MSSTALDRIVRLASSASVQASLRVMREGRGGQGDELAGPRLTGVLLSLAALRQGVDADPGENDDRGERGHGDGEQRPVPASSFAPFLLESPLRLVPATPCEYGLGQHVMEDLVLRTRGPVLAGAHDSLARQALEDALGVRFVQRGIASEIPGAVGDLSSPTA